MYNILYPTETLLMNLRTLKSNVITVHANYLKGGNEVKMNKMKDYNFWLTESTATEYSSKCHDYVPLKVDLNAAQ